MINVFIIWIWIGLVFLFKEANSTMLGTSGGLVIINSNAYSSVPLITVELKWTDQNIKFVETSYGKQTDYDGSYSTFVAFGPTDIVQPEFSTYKWAKTSQSYSLGILPVYVTAFDMGNTNNYETMTITDLKSQFSENQAPYNTTPQYDQEFEVNQEFELPLIYFSDDMTDTDDLSITVYYEKVNYSLPDFLRFQEALNKLTGKATLDEVLVAKFKDKGDHTEDCIIYINASDSYYSTEIYFTLRIKNHSPQILDSTIIQSQHVNVKFDFTINSTIFYDPDTYDTISYLAYYDQTNTTSLSWLQYSEETRRFGGTPSSEFFMNCTYQLKDNFIQQYSTSHGQELIQDRCQFIITMSGSDGLTAVNQTFVISVDNYRPQAPKPIYSDSTGVTFGKEIHITQTLEYIFASDCFVDDDSEDTLWYTATIVQYTDSTVWPSWLNFNDQMRKFSGTPVREDLYEDCTNQSYSQEILTDYYGNQFILQKDMCTYNFVINTTDTYQWITQNFSIVIYNYIPYSNKSFYMNQTSQKELFEYQVHVQTSLDYIIPTGYFVDWDPTDDVILPAISSTIPSWFTFNQETRRFKGFPIGSDLSSDYCEQPVYILHQYSDNSNILRYYTEQHCVFTVQVEPYDNLQKNQLKKFTFNITITNNHPRIINPIYDGTIRVQVKDTLNYFVPPTVFVDDDSDFLIFDSYNLPKWISFSQTIRRLSGVPSYNDLYDTCPNSHLYVVYDVTDASGNTTNYTETICPVTFQIEASDTFNKTNCSQYIELYNSQPYQNKPLYNSTTDGSTIYRVHIDEYIDYTFDEYTFLDVDPLDSLSYEAYLGDEYNSIPDFLSFNGQTRRFQGTPRKADVYSCVANNGTFHTDSEIVNISTTTQVSVLESICDYLIRVVATDGHDSTYAYMTYQIYNYKPYQKKPIYTKDGVESPIYVHLDTKLDFTITSGTFGEIDELDILEYDATLGNDVSLPSWLYFNTEIQRFNGVPKKKHLYDLCTNFTNEVRAQVLHSTSVKLPNANDYIQSLAYNIIEQQCIYTIIVEITDTYDVIESSFTLIIYNYQPYANYPIYQVNDFVIPYSIHVGDSLDLTIDPTCFLDSDSEDTLSYSARKYGTISLPTWLEFNCENQRFQGTPTKEYLGYTTVEVVVTDGYESLSQCFSIYVDNNSPEEYTTETTYSLDFDTSFNLLLSPLTFKFTDYDGDELIYKAYCIINYSYIELDSCGKVLKWLSFDSDRQTFEGTITVEYKNLIDFDSQNHKYYQEFDLAVSADDQMGQGLQYINFTIIFEHYVPVLDESIPSLSTQLAVAIANRQIKQKPLKTFDFTFSDERFTSNTTNCVFIATFQKALTDEELLNYGNSTDIETETIDDAVKYFSKSSWTNIDPKYNQWLKFDSSKFRVYGVPQITDIGYYRVKITYSDYYQEVYDTFTFQIYKNGPIANGETIEDQQFIFGTDFNISVPYMWDDEDDDELTYSSQAVYMQKKTTSSVYVEKTKTLSDVSDFWLTFDSYRNILYGAPDNNDIQYFYSNKTYYQQFTVFIICCNYINDCVNMSFVLTLKNRAPYEVGSSLQKQYDKQIGRAKIQTYFEFRMNQSGFQDEDLETGQSLNYVLTLSDGASYPNWLKFDTSTLVLSGKAPQEYLGKTLTFLLSVNDNVESVTDTLSIKFYISFKYIINLLGEIVSPVVSFLAIVLSYKSIYYYFFKKYYQQRYPEYCAVNTQYLKYIPLTQPYLQRAIELWEQLQYLASNSLRDPSTENLNVSKASKKVMANWFSVYIEEPDQKNYRLNYELLNSDIESIRNQLNQQSLNNISNSDEGKEYKFPSQIILGENLLNHNVAYKTYDIILNIFVALELCNYDKKFKQFYDYFKSLKENVQLTQDLELNELIKNEPFFYNQDTEWFTLVKLQEANYTNNIFPEFVPNSDKAYKIYLSLLNSSQDEEQVTTNIRDLQSECINVRFQLYNLQQSVLFGINQYASFFERLLRVQQDQALMIQKSEIRCVKMMRVGESKFCWSFCDLCQLFFKCNFLNIPFSDNMKLPQWMSLDLTNNYILLKGTPPEYYKGNYSIQVFNQNGRIVAETFLNIQDDIKVKQIPIEGSEKLDPKNLENNIQILKENLTKNFLTNKDGLQDDLQFNAMQNYYYPDPQLNQLDSTEPIYEVKERGDKQLIVKPELNLDQQ